MHTLSTTKMSSKGQVVIPDEIRRNLDLHTGSKFIVVSEKDVVILKKIAMPELGDFNALIKAARLQAKKSGLKKTDIEEIIKKIRCKK